MGGLSENPLRVCWFTWLLRKRAGATSFNVFDSAGAWESFRDGRRAAALREAMPEGVAPPKISIWELHSFASF
jgi:hypothetical protein